jgi:hypothetical protein
MIGVPTQQSVQCHFRCKSCNFTPDSAVFDDDNLVSLAGLVPRQQFSACASRLACVRCAAAIQRNAGSLNGHSTVRVGGRAIASGPV